MKVSVCIPVLARDALFERCRASLERSVAAVGGRAEVEFVVVEGISPVSAARNECLRRATGDWIAWVDGDDEVAESWFGEICRAIRSAEEDGSVDDIVFDLTVVRDERETVERYGREAVVMAEVLVGDMLRDMRIGNYAWLHVTRRRLWTGERFDLVPVMEDYVTMHRVLARAQKIAYVAKPLYRYVVRRGSLCNGGPGRQREIFRIAVRRAEEVGGPANIGTMVCAYNCLYDRADADGAARRWIRRHLVQALADCEVPWKWKLKFVLASLGVMVRRPK